MNAISKVSEITPGAVAQYIRLDPTADDLTTLTMMIGIAKAYIQGYTGLTAAELDDYEDFCIVVFILCQDMFDNRCLYVDNANLNAVADAILGMHRVNLL